MPSDSTSQSEQAHQRGSSSKAHQHQTVDSTLNAHTLRPQSSFTQHQPLQHTPESSDCATPDSPRTSARRPCPLSPGRPGIPFRSDYNPDLALAANTARASSSSDLAVFSSDDQLDLVPRRSGGSNYKRARTASPATTEELEAEGETEAGAGSDFADSEGNSITSGTAARTRLPTPLRVGFAKQSIGSFAPSPASTSPFHSSTRSSNLASRMSPDDQPSRAHLTSQDVEMADDQSAPLAAPSAQPRSTHPTIEGSLPTYTDAMQQSVSCHTPAEPGTPAEGTCAEELRKIKKLVEEPLAEGQRWYLIDAAWWAAWQAYCSAESSAPAQPLGEAIDSSRASAKPGPISARSLMDIEEELKLQLFEGSDFVLLPETAYASLSTLYGEAGPQVVREVIKGAASELRIELYPPRLYLYRLATPATLQSSARPPVKITLSVTSNVSQLKFAAKRAFLSENLPDHAVRFWRIPASAFGNAQTTEPVLVDAETLKTPGVELVRASEDAQTRTRLSLAELQLDEPVIHLAVESQSERGAWHFGADGVPVAVAPSVKNIFAQQPNQDYLSQRFGQFSTSGAAAASTSNTSAPPAPPPRPTSSAGRVTRSQTAQDRANAAGIGSYGLTGLYNLGNTCFMASALQCMSNTKELKEYFVRGVYKEEINTDNPLGMGGAVARAFGELLLKLWSSSRGSAVHPREFKQTLARFAPQFSGFAQQDTQELLAFLLDGLHEDLNRVKKKPYIEAPDWEGGDEKAMIAFAKRQWEIYKMRNDSVIVDLFQGQYKSTLVCPECSKVSIKFDPFMYLTLPIPNRKKIIRKVFVRPFASTRPTYEVEVAGPAELTFGQTKTKLAEWLGLDTKRLFCVDIFNQQIFNFIPDYTPLSSITDNDFMTFYELGAEFKHPTREALESGNAGWNKSKEAGPAPQEEYATLPVFGVASSSGRARYPDAVGLPLFVTIPKAHANDADFIRDAILDQYCTYATPEGRDTLEAHMRSSGSRDAVTAKRDAEEASPSDLHEQQMSNAEHDVVQHVDLSLSRQDPPDQVAEITSDGVRMVPDSSTSAEVTQASDQDAPNAQRPARRLFKMTFSNRLEDNAPMPKKPGSLDDGEELEARAKRLSERVPTASDVPLEDASDGGAPFASRKPDPENEVDRQGTTWPLVYTGGAIVCSWPEAAYRAVFAGETSNQKVPWGPHETFTDPNLVAEREAARANGGPSKPKLVTIEDCLDEFTKEEKLGAEDPWYCPSCKDFRQAAKKFDLWKVPDILVVHLKRFSAGRMQSRDKIENLIDFPIQGLDLTERVEGAMSVRNLEARGEEVPSVMNMAESIESLASDANDDAVAADAPIYDLYAVDNHFGGLGGGHYTAYAKNPDDGQWHYFDDSSVTPVADPESVKTKAAYLLFYRRRTTRPIGGKSREKTEIASSRAQSEAVEEVHADENDDALTVVSKAASCENLSPALHHLLRQSTSRGLKAAQIGLGLERWTTTRGAMSLHRVGTARPRLRAPIGGRHCQSKATLFCRSEIPCHKASLFHTPQKLKVLPRPPSRSCRPIQMTLSFLPTKSKLEGY
ncbi:UCH-domain-containing protein [Ceraceosorus guamensis]|uniref:ubiquitinyl hydrolase 1 n=1 Tax=Ceraceosorus guamensis TaxID=1522189 RepID=A0A316VTP4_9BASI|nr:UCH-domain-containing protein [Ceraceosorus guamensis]PWN40949.1 UCH-domain-containing protein [Ceraceosorus guamensis]